MWELYDALIDGISPDAKVDGLICGQSHTIVISGDSVGLAGTLDATWRAPILPNKALGMPL
ncbi:MAG: hypothetical protein LBC28_03500, partial [Oscillospiraceae bacterium]|nr:hypothetical protein [Oscillospiraceae bacterium]